MSEQSQVVSASSLRVAQHRATSLLDQFVQLPVKLKAIFDITKTLGAQVSSLVPLSIVQHAEARASHARMVEQRQTFHVELLQKRVQNLTNKVAELGGSPDMDDEPKKEAKTSEADTAA